MALSHARYMDARHSTFCAVGRDHITINQISFSLFGSRHTPVHFPLSSGPPQPTSHPKASPPRGSLVTTYQSSDIGAVLDTASSLAVRITKLLVDHRASSNNDRDLELELKSLLQALTLTGLAVQEYADRPLGQSLARTITPEAKRCCMVLQELFDKLNSTWPHLSSTSFSGLWCHIWQRQWDGNELASLRKELFYRRKSLEGALMALHS